MVRLKEELRLLDTIRCRHRQWQRDLQGIDYQARSAFRHDVLSYLVALVLMNAVGMVTLVWFWIPTLS